MAREFSPQTAIVTGADSGIGKATAVALARAGMRVGITWHTDEEGAESTAAEVRALGVDAYVAQLDTTDLATCGDVVDRLADQLGGCDVFVNNAGVGASTAFTELQLDDWRTTVATNLDGAFVCLQRAARRMVAAGRGGRLIAVTSVHEHQPRVGSSSYDAAKHGLGGLIKTIALELAADGITANSVAPGEIATPMTARRTRIRTGRAARECRSAARVTPARWRPSSPSSPHPPRAMSPALPGWSTVG